MDGDIVQLRGTIVSVSKRSFNTELVGSHSSGVSSLTVDEAFNFNPDGGTLAVGGETYTYMSVDDDTGVIELSGVTSAAYDDGDEVGIRPARNEKIATVVIDGTDSAIPARIIHVLEPFLAEGVREPDEQEYALLTYDGEEYLVFDAPGKVPAIDSTAIVAAPETVYIDGPPDFYSDSAIGSGPLLTYAEMAALADPAWVAMLDGITADNGTIVLNSADTGTVGTEYYPVWLVPNEGRSFRVVLDDITLGGSAGGFDEDYVGISVSMQENDGSYGGAPVDGLQVEAYDYSSGDLDLFRWYDYVSVYFPGAEPALQAAPIWSLTPAEATLPLSPEQQALPQTSVCITHPLTQYQYGWTTQHIITITGLRVELL